MTISEIKEKNIWEDFLLGCEQKTFLSSWNWGEFNKMMGNKIWRLGIYEGDKLVSVAMIVKVAAKRGTFMFIPHAPSVALSPTLQSFGDGAAKEGGPASAEATAGKPTLKYEILKTLLNELKKIAKEEGASFIRISPIWEKNEENIKVFKDLSFKDAPIHMHPELTWELDITPSEEELLKAMRKTTRYLIRQAQKNTSIKIIQSQQTGDLEKFNSLYQETVDRHHFVPFPQNYLKNEFLSFRPDNQILIFLAKYQEEVISSAMIIFWSNIAFYHQGASSVKHSKIPASYLLQWEAINEAKKRGCHTYNFWGIAEKNWKLEIGNWKFGRHPWAGLTLFKKGFGGCKKEYVKTQDLPLSNKYWLTFAYEKLRKAKRGL